MIVEGDVVTVRKSKHAYMVTVTLTVDDWIKPRRSDKSRIDFHTTADEQRPTAGEHLLVIVQDRPTRPAHYFRPGTARDPETVRAQIERDLPKAADTECPGWWRDDDGSTSGVPADS